MLPLELTDGDELELLLVDGEVVLPLAEVEPDALPLPEDWLVCAPWSIVEDGLVVVALWSAVAPLEELTLPEPMFTSGLTFAPAFTSVLLMPTLASTPTLGLTFVLLEVDGLVCADGSVAEDEDVWAKAGPNAPITAAAVILTANFRTVMLSPFMEVTPFVCRKAGAGRKTPHMRVDNLPHVSDFSQKRRGLTQINRCARGGAMLPHGRRAPNLPLRRGGNRCRRARRPVGRSIPLGLAL